jgi:serine/threonine protein kinase
MAEVFLAADEALEGAHRLVVIKQMLPGSVEDEHSARMFRHEARIAMQLNHPNIGQVFDAGLDGQSNRYSLVMEFIHGVDLRQILDNEDRPMLPAVAVYIAAQVAAGLSHAHDLSDLDGKPLNVVHRDISPPNIRISHDGAVKLIDFGVAKAAGGSYISLAGVTKGKYGYMAPEQVAGDPVDPRTDVFALGNVLHEMLTYRPLFCRDDINETLRAVMGGDVPAPSTVARRALPTGVDDVVLKALATEPARRYQTAKAMQRDLELVLRHEPASTTDLEELVTALFGDGRERLARMLEKEGESKAPEAEDRTAPAIPSRKTAAPDEEQEEGWVDEESTVLGYQRLRDDD